ncbi:hypothetical protein GSbR_21980 [Geobacter sp. SVR]|nr:hypothetical protein GSVR_15840 [Geobacter sp. SVR]GCF85598.1 hypothetical protein GSbR_21980 [Geobacter sp. SVR]
MQSSARLAEAAETIQRKTAILKRVSSPPGLGDAEDPTPPPGLRERPADRIWEVSAVRKSFMVALI